MRLPTHERGAPPLPHPSLLGATALLVLAACAAQGPAADGALRQAAWDDAPTRAPLTLPATTFTLPNGMRVTLHEDHSLPKVVIDTWFAVGSQDEAPGRTGFAHLFEHLMFMGTGRVPDDSFDVLMERGGGSNNASTSEDRTNYYSMGPSSLLPTLLWLDADRLEALDEHMTQEKLDLQREVVRNERRQSSENEPYGKVELLLPPALYPPGHPYHHPVIGSHEDLEAATLEDVVGFFRTYYVPGNASLVVAGDFDPAVVRPLVERTFGAIPAGPVPSPTQVSPTWLTRERRLVDVDRVEFPKLYLVWHSPASFSRGDAEMDLLAGILAGGPSTRLERRLVLEERLAQEVAAYQWSRELGSIFVVEALATPGVDLEAVKHAILEEIEELAREGPTAAELERVRAGIEASFLERMEGLLERADAMNLYLAHFGVADGFERDLQRYMTPTSADVAKYAGLVLGPGRVDLRILPDGARVETASLDERPADLPPTPFTPPLPRTVTLSNGWTLHALERPGSGLFAGSLLLGGGAAAEGAEQAGLESLLARVVDSGAGGKDASDFAAAVEALGASMGCAPGRTLTSFGVSGLVSRLDPTLDLFADLVLRPNLAPADFEREQALGLAAIRAREDDPGQMAGQIARALVLGKDDPLGRPLAGWEATVGGLRLEDVRAAHARRVETRGASLVFAGDLVLEDLAAELERRFGAVRPTADPVAALPRPAGPGGRLVLFDRPGAPQTVVQVVRQVPPQDGLERAVRSCVATVFGGTFTSRLNANLREDKGYTYGAGCRVLEEGPLALFVASTAVRTDVTGAALAELRGEFERMAAAGITQDELSKAVETLRRRLAEVAETTGGLAATYADLVGDGRPLDFLATQLAALDEVTPALANDHARAGTYGWDAFTVVLVGDRAAIEPQLAAAGFPAPQLVDQAGQPVE